MMGEIEGIKIYVNDETYTKYKKTLEDEIEDLQQENQELKRNCNIGNENLNFYREENQKLKKQIEELEEENFNLRENIYIEKMSFPSEVRTIKELIEMTTYEEQIKKKKEFIEYLENEKDRLSRECSHIYENSLGTTRLVNEDIFNEVDTILSKYKEIIGGKE